MFANFRARMSACMCSYACIYTRTHTHLDKCNSYRRQCLMSTLEQHVLWGSGFLATMNLVPTLEGEVVAKTAAGYMPYVTANIKAVLLHPTSIMSPRPFCKGNASRKHAAYLYTM